ncbi:MAG: hypothetical protein AAF318_07650 [Pseudomonadota bacterium]
MPLPAADPPAAPHRGRAIPKGPIPPGALEPALLTVCPEPDIRRDLMRVMMRDFVASWDVRENIPAGPRVFITNHQSASDITHFCGWLAGLTGCRVEILMWDGHFDLDAAGVSRAFFTFPETGERSVSKILRPRPIDQSNPRDVIGTWRSMISNTANGDDCLAVVCARGETETYEGEPLTVMSAAILDEILRANLPITPVRFNWGAPDTPGRRNMWSVDFAPQHVASGASLSPAALLQIPRGKQREAVLDGVNALTVPRPAAHLAAAAPRANRIRALAEETGMGLTKAAFCDGLFTTAPETLTEDGRLFVELATVPRAGDRHGAHTFMGKFARWLSDGYGPSRIPLKARYPLLDGAP